MTLTKQRQRKCLHRYLVPHYLGSQQVHPLLRCLGSQQVHLPLRYLGSQQVHPPLRYLGSQLPSLPEFFSLAVNKARCSSRTRHSHLLVVASSFRVGTSRWAVPVVATSPTGGSSSPEGHKRTKNSLSVRLLCITVREHLLLIRIGTAAETENNYGDDDLLGHTNFPAYKLQTSRSV